jgi:hypothetical protein
MLATQRKTGAARGSGRGAEIGPALLHYPLMLV